MGVQRGVRRNTDASSDGDGPAPFCPPSYTLEPLEEPKDLQVPSQEGLQQYAERRIRADKKLTRAIAERKAQLTKVLQGCLDRVNEQLEHGELPCTKAHFPAVNPFDFEDLEALANHDFTVDLHADEVDKALRDFVASILGIVWSNVRLENEGQAKALRRFNDDLRARMEILESCLQERSKQLSNCRFAYWQEITHLRNQVYFKEKEAENFEATLAYFFDPTEYLEEELRGSLNERIKQSVRAYQTRLNELTLRNSALELQLESAGGRFKPMESDDMERVLRALYSKHGWKRIVDTMGNDMCKKELLQWARAQGLVPGAEAGGEGSEGGGLGEELAEARAQSAAAWKQVEKMRQALTQMSSQKDDAERLQAETEERLEEKLRLDAGQEGRDWMAEAAEEERRALASELEATRRDLAMAKLAQERERARADHAEERAMERATTEPRLSAVSSMEAPPPEQAYRRMSTLARLQQAHSAMQQQETERLKTRESLRKGEGVRFKQQVQKILGQGKLISLLRARANDSAGGGAASSSATPGIPEASCGGSSSSTSSPSPRGHAAPRRTPAAEDRREQAAQAAGDGPEAAHAAGGRGQTAQVGRDGLEQLVQKELELRQQRRAEGTSSQEVAGDGLKQVLEADVQSKLPARLPLLGLGQQKLRMGDSAAQGDGAEGNTTWPVTAAAAHGGSVDPPSSRRGTSPKTFAKPPLPGSPPGSPGGNRWGMSRLAAPGSPGGGASARAAPASPSGGGGSGFRLAAAAVLREGDDGSFGELSARGRGLVPVADAAYDLGDGRGGGSTQSHGVPASAHGMGGTGGHATFPSDPGERRSGDRAADAAMSVGGPLPASSSGGQAIWSSSPGDNADAVQRAARSARAQGQSPVSQGGGHAPSFGAPGEGGDGGGHGAALLEVRSSSQAALRSAGVQAPAADAASARGAPIRGSARGGAGPELPSGALGGLAVVAASLPPGAQATTAMLGPAAAASVNSGEPAGAPDHGSSTERALAEDALQEDIDRVTESLIHALGQRSEQLNEMELEVYELRGLLEESSRLAAEVTSPKVCHRSPDDVRAAMVGMARLANFAGAFYATGRQASKSFCGGPTEAAGIRGRLDRAATAGATEEEAAAAISSIEASLSYVLGRDRGPGLEQAATHASRGSSIEAAAPSRGSAAPSRGSAAPSRGSAALEPSGELHGQPRAASTPPGPGSRGDSPGAPSPPAAAGLHVPSFGVRAPPPEELEAVAGELDDMVACARGSWDRTLQYIRGQLPPPVGYGSGMCERVAFVRLLQGIRHRSARLDELVAMVESLKRGELEKLLEGACMLMESRLPDQDQEFRDLLFGRGLSSEALKRSSGVALQQLQRRWDRLAGRMVQALLRSSDEVELGVHPGRRAYVHPGQGGAAGGGLAARQMRDFSPALARKPHRDGEDACAPFSDAEGSGSDADRPIEDALRIHQLVPSASAKAETFAGRPRGQRGLLHDALAYCEGPVPRGALHEEGGGAALAVDGRAQVETRARPAPATKSRSPSPSSPKEATATVFEHDLTHEQSSKDCREPGGADQRELQQPGGPPAASVAERLGARPEKGPVEARGRKLLDEGAGEAPPRRPGAAPPAAPKRQLFTGPEVQPEEKVTLSQLLRTKPAGDMDEPQAEPAPADLDVTALLKKAKESRGADPWRDREHARFLRGGTAAATGDGGPVPSWVVEQQGAGRSRPVGGRHTTGLLRPAAGAGAGADPADATLRRVASAGRLRQARVVAAPAGGTGAGVEAFGGAPAARRVLPAVSRPGTR